MNCLDNPEMIDFSGWIDDTLPISGKAFSISIRKCTGSKKCKEDSEIDKFILNH